MVLGNGTDSNGKCKPVGESTVRETGSRPSEEELHVFGREFVHGDLVVVDGPVDHVGFLLLQ
jgi:hypothetical protein